MDSEVFGQTVNIVALQPEVRRSKSLWTFAVLDFHTIWNSHEYVTFVKIPVFIKAYGLNFLSSIETVFLFTNALCGVPLPAFVRILSSLLNYYFERGKLERVYRPEVVLSVHVIG